jgi:catechol 2,3-dioxygenase-like lactoylglutathione lyase family enzyme
MTHAKLVPELLCSNLEKTLHFYVELVGFTIQYDRPEDRFAYLSMDGVEIMVEEAPETSEDPRVWWTAKAVHPYGRGINLQIEVADIDLLLLKFQNAGWPLFRPIEEKWYRLSAQEVGNRQFLVQDPDGYLLRFFKSLG